LLFGSQIALRIVNVGLLAGAIDLRLERPRIELEEQVVFLDHLPVNEMHLLDMPAHARTPLDGLGGLKPAVVRVKIDEIPLFRMLNGHLRRNRNRRGGSRGTAAAANP